MRSRARRPAGWVTGILLAAACRSEPPGEVHLDLGTPEGPIQLRAEVAFAEYLELPGLRNELRLTIASYEASCDHYVSPAEGEAAVTVLVVTPPDAPPAEGTYAWGGVDPEGGTVQRAYAVPRARVGRSSHGLPPGGAVRLTQVQLDRHGAVSGLLDFEFSGDEKRAATRLTGSFRAKICRSNKAPQR